MAANAELEAQILQSPDDLTLYQVYADWLIERGDLRGELIALSLRAQWSGSAEDAALATKFMEDHAEVWFGDLADKRSEKDLLFSFRLGLLDSVRIGPPLDKYECSELDFGKVVRSLSQIPYYGFIREITVGGYMDEGFEPSWDHVIQAFAEVGIPKNLASLTFDCGGLWDISSTSLGRLSPLCPALSGLKDLRIRMGAMDLSAINLPHLESLTIVTGGLTEQNLRDLAEASWPNLTKLSICVGESDNYGCTVTLPELFRFLRSVKVPKVTHLGILNTSLSDELPEALSGTPLLRQLKVLDLSLGTFSDVGARAILDRRDEFSHLEELVVNHHYVTTAVAEELATLGPTVTLGDAEDPEGGDPEDRYCAITE
jgi:uncharacterized protein (TIGR02996 family)